MKRTLDRYFDDESGAVTVDWVVLTAALIGIAMLFLVPIAFSADSLAKRVGAGIGDTEIGTATE